MKGWISLFNWPWEERGMNCWVHSFLSQSNEIWKANQSGDNLLIGGPILTTEGPPQTRPLTPHIGIFLFFLKTLKSIHYE